jgi:hypothetical protein
VNKTKEIVLKAIEDLRPYLHNDGGDMELVEITRRMPNLLCKFCHHESWFGRKFKGFGSRNNSS